MQLRILATSVAGLPAALDAALDRFEATITGAVLGAVRAQIDEQVRESVDDAIEAGGGAGGGSAVTRSQAVVDAGPIARREFWSRVAAPVTPTSLVLGAVNALAPGKPDDEVGLDVIDVWCVAGDGFVDVRLTGLQGPLAQKFAVDLAVLGR